MTLKKELEILRGEPIKVFDGDPMDIPCIETSDAEKLCKHPVVSVHMITYNHEPYIRQAIEGVMMQKTDFEFELVIGEDCSQDKTREICFEYQQKYPDKIRVLWWHENVSKLGGNGRRNRAHCRGEFIAFCEGDDCWTDKDKLKKQIDLIRKYDAGLCVGKVVKVFPDKHTEPDAFKLPEKIDIDMLKKYYFHTSTYLVRSDIYKKAHLIYPRIEDVWWDVITLFCISSISTTVFLDEFVSMRRITYNGIASSLTKRQLCCLVLRQYLPLYRFGPKGEFRRHFAKVVLSNIRQIVLFSDEKSMKWLRMRRWFLFRLFIEISVHEIGYYIYVGMLDMCHFIRDIFPVFFGRPAKTGHLDGVREF